MNETEPIPLEPLTKRTSFSDKTLFNLDDFLIWKLLQKRILIFHGTVDENQIQDISIKLEYLGSVSKKPIKIVLNSVGGEVYSGLLLFDTIKDLIKNGIEVTCEVRGLAASMGIIILQAGTRRLAAKYSRLLVHEVSSWSFGKATELEEQTEETKKVNEMLATILSERSGKTVQEIQNLIKKKEYWMSAEEALQLKFIDEII